MKLIRKTLVGLAAVTALVLSACGGGDLPGSAGAEPRDSEAERPHGSSSFAGINALVNFGKAGVVGTVVKVSDPKPLTTMTLYDSYVDVTVAVEEVLFDSPGLRLQPGAEITVHSAGSGRPEGEQEHTASGTPFYKNQSDGPFKAGERALLILAPDSDNLFPPSGTGPQVEVVQDYQGHWTLTEEGVAVSVEERRNADAARLKAKIRAERARGADPSRDRCTVSDPFGDEKPGCRS